MNSTADARQISLVQLAVGLGAAWVATSLISKYISLRSVLKSLGNGPGQEIMLFHPLSPAAHIVAMTFPSMIKGMIADCYGKFSSYRKYGSTSLISVAFWGSKPVVWSVDPDVFRVVTSERPTFIKRSETLGLVNVYGPNLVGTEGAEWKRHRDVVRSAFNEANTNFVWEESVRITNEWFDADLASQIDGEEIDLLPAFKNVALSVISSAGFGRRIPWASISSARESVPHPSMDFFNAIKSSSDYFLFKGRTPTCVRVLSQKIHIPWLTPTLNNTTIAFESLRRHMIEIISDARAARTPGAEARSDYDHEASQGAMRTNVIKSGLLGNLVEANMHNEKRKTLNDDELLSNTHIFLFAGHETSAHTLCFAALLLAAHPDKQRKVFQEVNNLWPSGAPTSDSFTTFKESMPKLEYTNAVINEAIRMFPPVTRIARTVTADTSVKARIFDNNSLEKLRELDVNVKAGGHVVLDVMGLHMSPLAWGDDAENFKPERFIDTEGYRWPREAFAGFSMGPRSCIGQRFALAEMVCVIALLVRRYEVLVPASLEGKTMEEKQRHMLAWTPVNSTTPINTRVRVKERSN